ncbi:hypothetical protein C8R43DRAFT_948581 [Mycena crocata]|nr:hypothetical protein C8R43DRAFT_948581 [Mycena crocata]
MSHEKRALNTCVGPKAEAFKKLEASKGIQEGLQDFRQAFGALQLARLGDGMENRGTYCIGCVKHHLDDTAMTRHVTSARHFGIMNAINSGKIHYKQLSQTEIASQEVGSAHSLIGKLITFLEYVKDWKSSGLKDSAKSQNGSTRTPGPPKANAMPNFKKTETRRKSQGWMEFLRKRGIGKVLVDFQAELLL